MIGKRTVGEVVMISRVIAAARDVRSARPTRTAERDINEIAHIIAAGLKEAACEVTGFHRGRHL
jgi:hypothetical protein